MGFLFLATTLSYAQNVGINTTGAAPDAGAGLDINFTDKGVLVPRVNITDLNTIAPVTGSTTTSLLVFNTNTTTGVGYYYWNGAQWVKFSTAADGWQVDGNAGLNAADNFLGTTDYVAVRIRTNNTNRFEFTTNGRLRSFNNGSAGAPSYSWTNDADLGMYRIGVNILGFSSAGAERMRINNTGQVLVNTTVSTDPNQFESRVVAGNNWATTGYNSTNNGGSGFFFNESAGNGYSALEGSTNGTGIGVFGLHLPGAGNGIGLQGVSNSGGGIGILGGNPAGNWAIFGNGFSGGTTNWLNVSDEMFKSNITPLENALDIVSSLNPKSYEMNTDQFPTLNFNPGLNYGFVAQEVQQVLPTLVKEGVIPITSSESRGQQENQENVTALAMDYVSLIPILTKAIQEQQEQIETLEQRIEALENALSE